MESVHEGKKPNSCDFCDKAYYRKTDLIHHVNTVHKGIKKKSNSCDICDKTFYRKRDLIYHINSIHKGIKRQKPFKCDFCDAGYYRKLLLERHVAIIHKIEIVPTKMVKMVGEMDNQSEKINVFNSPMDTFNVSNKSAVNAIASKDIITKESSSVPLNSENNSTKKDTTHCSRALPSTSKPNVKSHKEILESKSFQDYVAGLIN